MTTKLTLTIDKEVIEGAKVYAKSTQRSLSELVQKFLENLIKKEKEESKTSVIDKLAGSLPLPQDFDYDKALDEYYTKKYGL